MIIDNKLHQPFPGGARFSGWILIIFGIVALIKIWGIGLILLGSFFAFTRVGITIDFERKVIRNYSVLWGIKFGKWEQMSDFQKVRINKKKVKYSMLSWSNRQLHESQEVFEILFLREGENKGLLVDIAGDLATAKEKAATYKQWLNA